MVPGIEEVDTKGIGISTGATNGIQFYIMEMMKWDMTKNIQLSSKGIIIDTRK